MSDTAPAPVEEVPKREAEAPAPAPAPRPKRTKRKKYNDNQLRYFNGEIVQEGDKVSIHFSNGSQASTGTVIGRAQENQSLVQVIINRGEEGFCAEDGEWYYPGSTLVIHGSFLLPLSTEAAAAVAATAAAEEKAEAEGGSSSEVVKDDGAAGDSEPEDKDDDYKD
jgi:hypothetical protein